MKKFVTERGKRFFLLVLCAALAAASGSAAVVIRADEISAEAVQPGDSQPGAGNEAGEKVSGEGGAKEEPGDGNMDEASGEGDEKEEPGDENTKQEPGEDDTNVEPGTGDTTEKPDEENKKEKVQVLVTVKLTKNQKAASIKWKRVKGASAYKVQRSSKKNSGFKNIAALEADGRTYKDQKVKRGSRYYYRVAAKMEDGSTCYSKVFSLACPLGQVSNVKLIRYSTSSIKVTWDKSRDKNAGWYKVYYATKKDGKYKLAGTTANNWYRVKNLKNYQSYYFRVEACVAKKSSAMDSAPSKTVTMVTRPYERTTIIAGDSIITGFSLYGTIKKWNIGGNKKVVAAIGLNTLTFRTKKAFSGLSATQSIVKNKPYRVYIMLGDNDIEYCKPQDVVGRYETIVKEIQSGSPSTDIVVLAASPVTASTKERRSGFKQIPAYNKGLEAMAKKMGVRFYDGTACMKDSTGWLKSSYAGSDGIHWKPALYDAFAKVLEAYDKSLD